MYLKGCGFDHILWLLSREEFCSVPNAILVATQSEAELQDLKWQPNTRKSYCMYGLENGSLEDSSIGENIALATAAVAVASLAIASTSGYQEEQEQEEGQQIEQ